MRVRKLNYETEKIIGHIKLMFPEKECELKWAGEADLLGDGIKWDEKSYGKSLSPTVEEEGGRPGRSGWKSINNSYQHCNLESGTKYRQGVKARVSRYWQQQTWALVAPGMRVFLTWLRDKDFLPSLPTSLGSFCCTFHVGITSHKT